MATYTNITNALVAVGAKPFSSTVTALRDNTVSIAEKDSSVPVGLRIGTYFLGTITTTSGSSQSLTSLDLSTYSFVRLVFVGVSTNNAAWVLQVDGQTIMTSEGSAATMRGMMNIDLANGVFSSQIKSVGTNASTNADAFVGDTNITNATTTITVATSAGSFDAGTIRVYGIR